MISNTPVSPQSMYSTVTTALVSRVPVLNTVRKRFAYTPDQVDSQPTQQRTRSPSASSTASADSNATTIAVSGTATPVDRSAPVPEKLCMSRVNAALGDSNRTTKSGGVNRDAATIGTTLATTALSRLDLDVTDSTGRGMYIDAVKYMIRGLPDDLSETERGAIEISNTKTPHDGSIDQHQTTPNSIVVVRQNQQSRASKFVRSSSARIVSLLVSTFYSLLLVGIPIFALLFTRLVEYERHHHLSEKALKGTRNLADGASTAIVRASQSRSGAYLLATILCVVQSILEGAGDGINESTLDFGARFKA